MAQDSIAYGESLLANIRDRNDKLRSQAKKEAKKDQWKSLAVNIGMSVADDIFAGKQAQILNNEDAMRNKIQITAADDYANGVIAEHGQAESYKGGVNSWLMDNIKNELDFQYSQTYAKGNRNELEFNELVNSEAGKIFDARLKEYNARLEATKEHLAGGDLARYNANMAQLAGKGTAGGALVGLLTKLTGNSNADLYNSQNEEILRQSKEYQETYNSTWKQTRSATLAKAVAENMPSDLGLPSPKFGTPYTEESVDFLGNTVKIRITPAEYSVRNKEGKVVQITRAMTLGPNGYVPYTPRQQSQDINMAVVAGALNTKEIAAGKVTYDAMSGEDKANIRNIFAKQIKLESGDAKLSKGDSGYDAQLAFKEDAFVRRLVSAGKIAQEEGWGSRQAGQKIFLQAVKNKIESEGSVNNLGKLNIFDTMFAMQELTTTNKLPMSKSGMQYLANRPEDMYTALEGMNFAERNKLFNRLKDSVDGGVNYFEGNINSEDFKADILGFKNIFNNQKKYNLDKDNFESVNEMLIASIRELSQQTTEEKNAEDSLERREARLEQLKKMSLISTL